MTGLDPRQLRDYVVRPALAALGLPGGEVAERLVMGTAAQESNLQKLHQAGKGPALSLWEIEPSTAADAITRASVGVRRILFSLAAVVSSPDAPPSSPEIRTVVDQLPGNLYLGAALCRVVYYLKPFAMPASASVADLAAIWKQHYNTPQGAGTVEEFIGNWRRYLGNLYPD